MLQKLDASKMCRDPYIGKQRTEDPRPKPIIVDIMGDKKPEPEPEPGLYARRAAEYLVTVDSQYPQPGEPPRSMSPSPELLSGDVMEQSNPSPANGDMEKNGLSSRRGTYQAVAGIKK